MSAPTVEQVSRWWRTLEEHSGHGRCRAWAEAFASLIETDQYHLGAPPADDRPHPTAGDQKETTLLNFVRPTRCDNSGPNCVEVAIDVDGSRIVRNSQEPATQVRFNVDEWTAFVESVRAGQPL